MPDTAWPINGHPPDSSRAVLSRPGFDVTLVSNDTSTAIHLRSSSRPPPDAITGAFYTSLTTTPSSRRELPNPRLDTDPDVNLSIHPARAVQLPGRVAQLPVRKQAGHPFPDTTQPFSCTSVTAFQPFVLPSRPVHQVAINTPAQRTHHAWIEHREVVEPAPESRVHATREVVKGQKSTVAAPGSSLQYTIFVFSGCRLNPISANRRPIASRTSQA